MIQNSRDYPQRWVLLLLLLFEISSVTCRNHNFKFERKFGVVSEVQFHQNFQFSSPTRLNSSSSYIEFSFLHAFATCHGIQSKRNNKELRYQVNIWYTALKFLGISLDWLCIIVQVDYMANHQPLSQSIYIVPRGRM